MYIHISVFKHITICIHTAIASCLGWGKKEHRLDIADVKFPYQQLADGYSESEIDPE